VRLSGATISGQLACDGATLENAGGKALNVEGAQIGGGVFLDSVIVKGEVGLTAATITGQLACEDATLENGGGKALFLQQATVNGGFIWRAVKQVSGDVDMTSAHVGDLVDDAASWDKCDGIRLVGLTYDVLHGATNVQERLAWLKKGAQWKGDFHPQPYEQLAKVLRESGHRAEAREIAINKEIAQRKAARTRRKGDGFLHRVLSGLRNTGSIMIDTVLRLSVGYGYKPERSIYVVAVLVLVAWVLSANAWDQGDFAPNSDVILVSDHWQALAMDREGVTNPAADWADTFGHGQDYATFNAFYYAVDVVIPIVDLGQETVWAPSTNRGLWGWWLFYLNPVLIALGWIVTAIGAAAVTGIIRRD
jgi:hypothetical protein